MPTPLSPHNPRIELVRDLRTPRVRRERGRFVFDGLSGGDYELSVFSKGFPQDARRLTDPKTVHVEEKSCASVVLGAPAAGR